MINKGKKEWMTILDLIEQRRRHKNDGTTYKNIQKTIRKKIREAKKAWISAKCREIEELNKRHNNFNLQKSERDDKYHPKKNYCETG